MHPYTEDYYAARKELIRSSARVVVPLVLDLVQPRSVIDVGCGTGDWLSTFREHGVEDIWGIDGPYVSKKILEIPEERFIPFDLEQPFHLDRRFDLVVSLEVAEHLPRECAETFVNSLTSLGSVVLFSAAIPHQGGKNHINEQWPEYWAKHFHDKDFVVIDCLRRKIWCNEKVQRWYAQNTLLFATREYLEDQPLLNQEYELRGTSQLATVHPSTYMKKIEDAEVRHQKLREESRRQVEKLKSNLSEERRKAQSLEEQNRKLTHQTQQLQRTRASALQQNRKLRRQLRSKHAGLKGLETAKQAPPYPGQDPEQGVTVSWAGRKRF
ncbi:MAG: methyltransferase domain-containing protein [Rubrobacter sp.]|nr:methyltransferase domain-containing protein [Rubrobacter sp.]